MRRLVPEGLRSRALRHPAWVASILYLFLGVIFFGPGLIPGHTISAADYLWSAAPWTGQIPKGLHVWSTHPLIVGSNPQLVDSTTVFEPFLQYTRSQLPHVPLWDPYIMGGAPLLGDMQSAIFSPFSIPAYILPFWWSLGVIAVMKVVVASIGSYLLARSLNMRFAGAFMCGLVFGFGLYMIAWIPWPLTNVFPLIPWMLFASERLVRRPGPLPVAALATLVMLQFFGGHPESSFQALFCVGCFFVLRSLQGENGGVAAVKTAAREKVPKLRALAKNLKRPLIGFLFAVVLGTALAAIVILPFAELLRNSSDLSSRPRDVYVQPKFFFASLLPSYFDGAPQSFEIQIAFYAGALPLMLALIALLRRKVERILIALFAAGCVLVVLGIQPFFHIVGSLPGFDETYLSRLTVFYLLGISLLAGWGFDDLLFARPTGKKAVVAGSISGALLIAPVVVVGSIRSTSLRSFGQALKIAWLFASRPAASAPNVEPIVRLAALIIWLTIALAACVLLYLRLRRNLAPVVFAVLAIALVVGDVFQAGMGENPAIPDSHATQPVTGAIRLLQAQTPARYVGVVSYVGINPLPPDVNIRYGLYDARGYDLPVIARFGDLWSKYISSGNSLLPLNTPEVPIINLELDPGALRVLSLLGVKDLLQEQGQQRLNLPGLRVVYSGSDGIVYANDDAMPRTWLVDDEQVVRSATAQLDEIGSASFDAHETLITGSPLVGMSGNGGGSTSPGNAHITSYQAQRVVIEAHATKASELVLSDTYYPGWNVTVNGRSAPISEVDYLLRGVHVPAGNDKIVFTYDPSSFRTGWMVSLVSGVVLVAVLVTGVRRRRRMVRPAHN